MSQSLVASASEQWERRLRGEENEAGGGGGQVQWAVSGSGSGVVPFVTSRGEHADTERTIYTYSTRA